MKKAIAILLVIALASFMTIPALAVTGTVGKFTPTIDGEKDEAYTKSFSYGIFDQETTEKGEGFYSTYGDTATTMNATVYYLWDDAFLYAFVEVTMDSLTDAGKDFIMDSANPWEAEGVELWFLWNDLDDRADFLKTSVEPFYGKEWGEGTFYDVVAPNSKAVTKVTATGYNAEFKIAIPAEFLKEGGLIKATLQVNDFCPDGTNAIGQQIGDTDAANVLTLGAPIIIAVPAAPEAAPVPDEPVAANEPAPAPVVAAEPVRAAQTGDMSIFIMLGLIAVGSVALSALKGNKKEI